MKINKTLISSLILASFLFPSLSVLNAQVVDSPATVSQVDALKETLISLLTQLIAQLQEQINTLIAQQSVTQAQVATIVQNTTSTQTFGDVTLPAYSYAPSFQFGGSSESDRGHIYVTMPEDMVEGYISLYDNGARTKLKVGVNDFSGFNQFQNQAAWERANNIPQIPQTYNWTISARSADTSFATTTGSFLGTQAWVVN